ncbi:shikimate kinase [Flaviflexus massiliensis]|uniref:shikimate kinase n=1 Tax=Flaviflexus massiliensis TaxID=1522309 RepID=UPI0006D59B2A|nr:shikimate kinase [Flaviflexus massiliensis]
MIILVGPVGSGGTELLAEFQSRGLSVCDAEQLLEEREGESASDLLIFQGATAYAEAERGASLAALDSGADVVLLGSGALGNSGDDDRGVEVRARVDEAVRQGATKVFLTAEAKVLMNRAGLDIPRSVAIGSPRSSYLTHLKAREPLYSVGATTINTASGEWPVLADEIMNLTY